MSRYHLNVFALLAKYKRCLATIYEMKLFLKCNKTNPDMSLKDTMDPASA